MANNTVYRKAYQPPPFLVKEVSLNFDLYEDHVQVSSQLELQRQHPGPLHLYGDEVELVSIHLNETPLSPKDYTMQGDDLIITHCPDEFKLAIVTRIRPQENTSLSGLFRTSNRPNSLFCTQCEAEGFRRMTFYPDRPDVLSSFTTRITADKARYPELLSNGNLIDAGDSNDGRHWVVWHDPFKKPAYLFALVGGNLACVNDKFVTCSGREVTLRIYVEPGNEDKCTHAMNSLKKAMRWDEEEFGREYDLDIYMIVAVSDFNMGAMENKGLNIFNSKYILARPDTATDQDYGDVESVVGHEYFHNWSGNRVTCRDWFQLSLKEGLTVFRDQEFSRDMNSRDVNRIMDVKQLRNTQFPEDAGSLAHPVRPESYQEINNFYTATIYNKGAEVIRMQRTILGKEGFRRGMDLYFERYDGCAVTLDDFVSSMEDANHVDFTQFKRWYSQAGTPIVEVHSDFKAGTLTLSFKQSCPPTPGAQDKEPFHIPIRMALFNKKGEILPLEQNEVLELRKVEEIFTFSHLQEKPTISLLRDFSAPVIIKREISQDELLTLLRFETNGFAKWDAAQKLALNCLSTCYRSERNEWKIPAELIAAYRHVLQDDTLDAELRADILTPPSFEELAVILGNVDVARVEAVRDFYRAELGSSLYTLAEQIYQTLWQQEDHLMHAQAYSRRKLRNACLWLMMKAKEARALVSCRQQFSSAKTMTDQMASFALLVNCSQAGAHQQAVDNFYTQWAKDELVLDKWFALQATCELPGALDRVRHLLNHPAFQITNPNKVRALVGSFSQGNPRHFHALDGSGYSFLTEIILQIDSINPQIASRLATPFTRWQLLDSPRQALMKEQLTQLVAKKLSRDLQEVVEKSLII